MCIGYYKSLSLGNSRFRVRSKFKLVSSTVGTGKGVEKIPLLTKLSFRKKYCIRVDLPQPLDGSYRLYRSPQQSTVGMLLGNC